MKYLLYFVVFMVTMVFIKLIELAIDRYKNKF